VAAKNNLMELRKVSPQQGLENKQQESDFERRFISQPVEYRAVEGSDMGEVFGYALKWEVEYEMGGFTEKIARGALDKADLTDVRILQDHLSHLILGRTKSKTATVGTDEVGMWYRSSLPNSPNGQNMRESLIRGDVDQSSWGFQIRRDETGRRIGDKWEIRDGKEYRTIHDISVVFDASPVTFPANPDTSAAKRSRDEFFAERRDDMADAEEPGAAEMDAPMQAETGNENKVPAWEIAWMFETVSDCTEMGNRVIQSMNNLMSSYQHYAEDQTDKSAIFAALSEQCKAAKSSMVALIDGHIDALKELNASENRTEQKSTEQMNNSISDSILLELELKASQNRANKQKYDYEKICN
jgi:uncharacterized protein